MSYVAQKRSKVPIFFVGLILVSITSLFIASAINVVDLNKVKNKHSTVSQVTKSDEDRNIPADIIKRGDNYIINKVGEDYFSKNYKFSPDESYRKLYSANEPTLFTYFIYYEYIPLSNISGKKEYVRMVLGTNPTNDPSEWNSYVACVVDGVVCEPRVTRDEAMAAAKNLSGNIWKRKAFIIVSPVEAGFLGANKRDMKNWMWTIRYNETSQPGCKTDYYLLIDTITSEQRKTSSRICS